jgi:hypothetical protein
VTSIIWIAALTFLLRAFPGILGIKLESSDQTLQLLAAERIRENKFKRPERLRGLLGSYDYPPLFHYLLALFPRTIRERLAPFSSAVIDVIHVLVVYTFALYIMQIPELATSISNPSQAASIAALLFATSPALLYYGYGPRAYHATPRTLGELFTSVTLLSAGFYLWQGNWWALLLSCLFGGLTLLTSKFGAQVLVFFTLILAALLRSPSLLMLPLLSIIFAIILSRGHYLRVLIGQIKSSIRYKKFMHKFPINYRNELAEFKSLLVSMRERDFLKSGRALWNIINNNTYVILAVRNIMLFMAIYFGIMHFSLIISNPIILFLCSWITASLVLFSLTSLRPFLFLGEAERYIEHSILPQVLLVCLFSASIQSVTWLIIYHALFYIGNLALICGVYRITSKKEGPKRELFDWFAAQGIKDKIILPGLCGLHFELPYITDNAVLFPGGSLTRGKQEEFIELFEEYPYPNTNLQMLIQRYNLDLIVVNKKLLDHASKRGWNYPLAMFTKVFENELYTVYETKRVERGKP